MITRKHIIFLMMLAVILLSPALSQAAPAAGATTKPGWFVDRGAGLEPVGCTGNDPNNPSSVVIEKDEIATVKVFAKNDSERVAGGGILIPAVLCDKVIERDACTDTGCATEIPKTFAFVDCQKINPNIASCEPAICPPLSSADPTNCTILSRTDPLVLDGTANAVVITTTACTLSGDCATGGVLLPASATQVELVRITKKALNPITRTPTNTCGQFGTSADTSLNAVHANDQGVCARARGGGSSPSYFPSTPCIDVTKKCEPGAPPEAAACYPTDITISGTVSNCSKDALETLDPVLLTDNVLGVIPGANITNCTAGSSPTKILAGGSCDYSAINNSPVLGDNPDTITATGVDITGATLTDTASALCKQREGVPGATCEKIIIGACPTDPEGPVNYEIVFCADEILPCSAGLKNCKITDDAKANGASVAIDYTPDPHNPVPRLPNDNIPFDLAPGQCIKFTGLYSGASCPHDTITVINNAKIVCDNASAPIAPDTCTKTCVIPPCGEEICRTPGFWGTHAGIEKARSQNITQQVISKVGALTVCGQTIDDTVVGSCDSAVEAICVSVKGEGQRQLVRQLTAAALNCIMSSGNANCSGVSIDQTFADCNKVCQGIPVAGLDIGKCIGAIDCFNNGGQYKDGFCQTGTCSDNDKPCNEDNLSQCGTSNPFLAFLNGTSCIPLPSNCHERELCNEDIGLCFEPPGPAGSSTACNDARGNSLYVAEGTCLSD